MATKIYKFSVPTEDLEVIKATLPAVAEAGVKFTEHFYKRLFKDVPCLTNLFNQTNQSKGGQANKLFATVALAAQASITTGEIPGVLIEPICQKHVALNVPAAAYAKVGEHVLGTIKDLLTDDEAVLKAWGALYGDVAAVFTAREQEIKDELASTAGAWVGRREFTLVNKEKLSDIAQRFTFEPVDGEPVPIFQPGHYTTVWMGVGEQTCPHGSYNEQPRHYTLAFPRTPEDATKTLSISVKKQGLASSVLHDAAIGSKFDLSAPCGYFHMVDEENMYCPAASEKETTAKDSPVVFLSAGIGITPVLAMLDNVYQSRSCMTWLHSAHDGTVHAYGDHVREINRAVGTKLRCRVWYSEPTPEDGPAGGSGEKKENEEDASKGDEKKDDEDIGSANYHYEGRMDLKEAGADLLPLLHLENSEAQYYMCGPAGFMAKQREDLVALGVDNSRIHDEGFE